MKIKTFVLILFVISMKSFGQTNEELLKELNDAEQKSYFRVGVGLGNKIFSTHNNTLNAQQLNNTLVFTPSIGYFHKSGFSLTATGYALNSGNNRGFLQYAINPSYDYTSGKDITASISYSHYFVTSSYNTSLTPIQNDYFGSLAAKKGWLKPGIQTGYGSGDYKDITNVDTTIRAGGVTTHYKFIDTSTIKSSSFSFSGTLEHTFNYSKVFSENDIFSFIPQFMLNFGSSTEKILQSSSGNYTLLVKRSKLKKRNFKNKSQTTSNLPFTLESIAIDLEAEYSIGKFDIQPNLYLDYYLPSTSGKRLSKIFAINFAYNF